MELRLAREADLPAIVAIHNQAIGAEDVADVDAKTAQGQRAWLDSHEPDRRPIWVGEAGVGEADAQIVGWVSLSDYRTGRQALRHTAEISYFVDAAQRKRGYGRGLVEGAVERAPALGIRTLFAILLDDNTASVALLERCGFARWGHLPGVADFDGREVGHLYYGLRL
jgi:L-amino acid N-acyltransferase YncA